MQSTCKLDTQITTGNAISYNFIMDLQHLSGQTLYDVLGYLVLRMSHYLLS